MDKIKTGTRLWAITGSMILLSLSCWLCQVPEEFNFLPAVALVFSALSFLYPIVIISSGWQKFSWRAELQLYGLAGLFLVLYIVWLIIRQLFS